MLCLHPIHDSFACGQCMNCRINNQRIWACRILLESYYHPTSIFVTLTYDDKHCPVTESGLGTLIPDHPKKFVINLNKRSSLKYRYFAVGEYGEKSWRPHYHLILFGASLDDAAIIAKKWKKGFSSVSELNSERAQYVAQYTTKKMTKTHPTLGDRYPEFIRTSREKLVGGIGAPSVGWLAAMHRRREGRKLLTEMGDVWKAVRIDGKIWPLGPYLRTRLRQRLGVPELSEERQIFFDHYCPKTGELLEPQPLPETYCPMEDVSQPVNPRNNYVNTEARKAQQPDLEAKASRRARSRARRNQAIKV